MGIILLWDCVSPSAFRSLKDMQFFFFCGDSTCLLLCISVQILTEKENEKKALLETLLQTQGELTEACHQLEQLRQEVKEQQEYEQVSLTSRAGGKFKQLVTEHKLRERLLKPSYRMKGNNKEMDHKSWSTESTEPGKQKEGWVAREIEMVWKAERSGWMDEIKIERGNMWSWQQVPVTCSPFWLQNITEKLQAELQETHCKIKMVENMHKEEMENIKEEKNILLQQRDDLQKQVTETAKDTWVIK